MTVQTLGNDLTGPDGTLFPISSGVRVGNLILLSGQLALRDGKIVGQTVEEQTDCIIDNIEALLAPAGRGLKDVVKVTAWLVQANDFAGFNAAYARRFARPYPARSTVVSQLLVPGALIEIEVIVTAE